MSFWEDNPHAASESQWTSNPLIAEYVNRSISNHQSAAHWLVYLFTELLREKTFVRVLSIGCGTGEHEITMASFENVQRIDAFDASITSINIARAQASTSGLADKINFFTGDFNTQKLKRNYYDMVICTGSLHHVLELEFILSEVRGSLSANGLFVVNEYVGACYNIYKERQLSKLNEVCGLIPSQYIRPQFTDFKNPSIETVFARDPTEAVRALLIPDFLRFYFTDVDERKYGGYLLHPLYPALSAERLAASQEVSNVLFPLLIYLDRQELVNGYSDFSFFICRNGA